MWMIVTIIITSHEAGCLTNTLIHSRSAAARVTRLVAYLAFVFFGQLLENFRSSTNPRATFTPRYKLCINFDKIKVGPHFGRFFHELIRSPCLLPTEGSDVGQRKCIHSLSTISCLFLRFFSSLETMPPVRKTIQSLQTNKNEICGGTVPKTVSI
jgi:hypothetical protein